MLWPVAALDLSSFHFPGTSVGHAGLWTKRRSGRFSSLQVRLATVPMRWVEQIAEAENLDLFFYNVIPYQHNRMVTLQSDSCDIRS